MFRINRASTRPEPVVVPITDIPECEPGAPMPVVLATERAVAVAFFGSARWVADHRPGWERCVIGVRFERVRSHTFGAPNDEAFHGHPLVKFGLRAYEFARVENSPWIESLRAMNSVHPRHRDEAFVGLQHIVLPFHDTTFECVARGYVVQIAENAETRPSDMVRALTGN